MIDEFFYKLLYHLSLALFSLHPLLGLFYFGWFAKPAPGSLAREARFTQTSHVWFAWFSWFVLFA